MNLVRASCAHVVSVFFASGGLLANIGFTGFIGAEAPGGVGRFFTWLEGFLASLARRHAGQSPTAPMGGGFTPTRGRELPSAIKDKWL